MREYKFTHFSVTRMINLGMMDGLLIESKSWWHVVPGIQYSSPSPLLLTRNSTVHNSHMYRLASRNMGMRSSIYIAFHCCFCCLVAKSCPTLRDPMDYSLPGSSVHGISQARILEWVAISFSRGSSQPRDRTHVSCIGRGILSHWATWEACM